MPGGRWGQGNRNDRNSWLFWSPWSPVWPWFSFTSCMAGSKGPGSKRHLSKVSKQGSRGLSRPDPLGYDLEATPRISPCQPPFSPWHCTSHSLHTSSINSHFREEKVALTSKNTASFFHICSSDHIPKLIIFLTTLPQGLTVSSGIAKSSMPFSVKPYKPTREPQQPCSLS